MGLVELGAAVYKAIGILLTLLGIANTIDAKPVAEEDTPFKIQTATLATANYIIDPVFGIPRVLSNQAALLAALGSVQTTLLAAIGSPQQTGVAVTLPVTAPSGYGGPSSSANANAVWAFVSAGQFESMETKLVTAGSLAEQLRGWWPVPTPDNPLVGLVWDWSNPNALALPFSTQPTWDESAILPTDTMITWLNRIDLHGNLWAYNAHRIAYSYGTFSGAGYWMALVDDLWLEQQKRRLFPVTALAAPVWPGLAGVTLGSPVALSPTCVVTGPMHGVIIDITSAAPRQVYQVFGGMQGYRFVGGLQFVDDNGEAERIQSIGMQHEVIVCKSMAEAASCSIRTDSAVTGTATPFVIT